MGLSDVFKPRWKHSVSDVRLNAVKRLTDNDLEILKTVAMNDADDRVRVLAIEKISDPDLLKMIAREGKASDPVKKACVDRILKLEGKESSETFGLIASVIAKEDDLAEIAFKTQDTQIKKEMIERINDERVVWRIASEADDPSLKCLAVSKISDEALLAEIAQQNCGAKAGEMIVAALTSPDYLAEVAEKASSRKIRKMAEARIKKTDEPGKPEAPEEIEEKPSLPLPPAAPPIPDPALEAIRLQDELNRKKKEAAIKTIEAILKELPDGSDTPGEELSALIQGVEKKWAGVDMADLPPETREAFNNRYQRAVEKLNSFLKAHLDRLEKEKIRIAKEQQEKKAQEVREAEEQEKILLLKLLETVETASDGERFYEAEATVKSAKESWRKSGDRVPQYKKELSERFEAALSLFFDKLFEHRENRSWEKWANLNQKKELCVAVEALLPEDRLAGLANRVRDIFNTWKSIGPVDRDESDRIWERFRVASDTIYERCATRKQEILSELKTITSADETGESSDAVKKLQEAWNEIGILPAAFDKEMKEDFKQCVDDYFNRIRERFEKREQERQNNLEIKKALLDRARGLVNEPYGRKVVDEIIDLQKRWKETGPIPKSLGDALWEEFRSTCNQFFERIDREQNENLKAKEDLCEQAEKLVGEREEGLTDDQVRSRLIDLQQKWKEIGPVPRPVSDPIWKRFRTACDTFFNAYDGDANKRYEEKEALVVQAESLKDSTEWKKTTEELKNLQQAWKDLGAFQTQKDRELWDRFHQACDRFFTRRREIFKEKDSHNREILQKREALLTHAEMLVRMIHPEMVFEHLKTIPMDEQLSLSLSYRDEVLVPDDEKSTQRNIFKKIGDIRSEWHKLDKSSGEGDRELWTHFLAMEKAIRTS